MNDDSMVCYEKKKERRGNKWSNDYNKKSRNHFIPNCRLSWEVIIIATDWLLSFFIKNTVFSNLKKEWETVS